MSAFLDTSEIRSLAAGIERQQVMDVVRGATFVGTLLLGWISLHPFESLGDLQIGDVGTGNELATYAVFGGLSVLEKLLGGTAHLFLTGLPVVGLFARFEDDRGRERGRQGHAAHERHKKSAKGVFHRVAQGSYLTRPVKLAGSNK